MRLIPAIDLRDGRCVRLFKGDFEQETRYAVDPVTLAGQYRELGAEWLHVVDLDGAKSGAPVNLPLIERMRLAAGVAVQYGGGIRTSASLEQALRVVTRAVIGSLAVTDPAAVTGWFTTHGWTRASTLTLAAAIERYAAVGLRHVLCTDIDRDGALTGPNVDLYRDCVARWPGIEFQASGGVRNAADLVALSAAGAAAAVSGKALLEGRLTPEEIRPFLRGA